MIDQDDSYTYSSFQVRRALDFVLETMCVNSSNKVIKTPEIVDSKNRFSNKVSKFRFSLSAPA